MVLKKRNLRQSHCNLLLHSENIDERLFNDADRQIGRQDSNYMSKSNNRYEKCQHCFSHESFRLKNKFLHQYKPSGFSTFSLENDIEGMIDADQFKRRSVTKIKGILDKPSIQIGLIFFLEYFFFLFLLLVGGKVRINTNQLLLDFYYHTCYI